MNYVTRFVNYFGSYYGDIGLNEATTTGATDIVVVEQINGTLKSTPFHVRFGKLNLLRPKEVIVDLYVNNEYAKEVEMRVEPTGAAYFEMHKDPKSKDATRQKSPDNFEQSFTSTNYKLDEYSRRSARSSPNSESEPVLLNQNLVSISHPGIDILNDPGYRSFDEGNSESQQIKCLDIFDSLKMSLCGDLHKLNYSSKRSLDKFYRNLISYDDFTSRPSDILANPDLVILFDKSFIDWKTFSVIMIAQLAFNNTLKVNDASNLLKSQRKEKISTGYSSWFYWRTNPIPSTSIEPSSAAGSAEISSKQQSTKEPSITKTTEATSKEDPSHLSVATGGGTTSKTEWVINHRTRTLSDNDSGQWNNNITETSASTTELTKVDFTSKTPSTLNHSPSAAVVNTENFDQDEYTAADCENRRSIDDSAVHFSGRGTTKSNVLPSETLKLLKLKPGYNELGYVITSRYRGTIKVCCKIYLWKWSDRIVVSDIDGTITKSDVRGHLYSLIGADWTQPGIVQLYNEIFNNGYRIVYLSARAIGQANSTRTFLAKVQQQQIGLPDGPLLLAPGSIFEALRKEVIDCCPQEFKIRCLLNLKSVFPLSDNPLPLYAGFGNKSTDELTYHKVGIPQNRTFTVDHHGKLTSPGEPPNCVTKPTDASDEDRQQDVIDDEDVEEVATSAEDITTQFPDSYEAMAKQVHLYFPMHNHDQ